VRQAIASCGLPFIAEDRRQKPIACPTSAPARTPHRSLESFAGRKRSRETMRTGATVRRCQAAKSTTCARWPLHNFASQVYRTESVASAKAM